MYPYVNNGNKICQLNLGITKEVPKKAGFWPKKFEKMPTVSTNNKKSIPPYTDQPHPPYSARAPLKKWKLHRFYAVFLRKNPIKNPKKYIYRFLGPLISNPKSADHHHIRFEVIWRSNCKKSDKKFQKNTYIGFWGRWFRIRGPLTSIISDQVRMWKTGRKNPKKYIYISFWER